MKHLYSFALTFLLLAGSATAQPIPNGSFEVWKANGNPEGWTTNNQPPFVEMITKSSVHGDGSFSAHGEVLEYLPGQTAAPFIYSGTGQVSGFPVAARPAALNGFLATDLKGGDIFFVNVVLTKEAEAVGGSTLTLTASSLQLQAFSLPIAYVNQLMPDTATIIMAIMNEATPSPTVGSSFTIDGLVFGASTGAVAVDAINPVLQITDRGSYQEIQFDLPTVSKTTLEVIDVNGRTIAHLFDGVSSRSTINWNTSSLPSGLYLCRLTSGTGVVTRKVSIVR